jgi:hypothetical protein
MARDAERYGIGGEHVNEAVVQHLLAEIARTFTEATREAARRHLHPDAALHERDKHVVVPLDPREPLRMREHRHVTRGDEIEHRLGEPWWRHVVRRLQQKVTAAGERRRRTCAEASEQLRRKMRVGAERQAEIDLFIEQATLQRHHPLLDPGGVVLVETGINVRRARRDVDAIGDGDTRHLERGRLVGRTVVDTGQHVAVEVDHRGEVDDFLRAAIARPNSASDSATTPREDQARPGCWRMGSQIRNRVPRPGLLSTSMRPRCSSTIR